MIKCGYINSDGKLRLFPGVNGICTNDIILFCTFQSNSNSKIISLEAFCQGHYNMYNPIIDTHGITIKITENEYKLRLLMI